MRMQSHDSGVGEDGVAVPVGSAELAAVPAVVPVPSVVAVTPVASPAVVTSGIRREAVRR